MEQTGNIQSKSSAISDKKVDTYGTLTYFGEYCSWMVMYKRKELSLLIDCRVFHMKAKLFQTRRWIELVLQHSIEEKRKYSYIVIRLGARGGFDS